MQWPLMKEQHNKFAISVLHGVLQQGIYERERINIRWKYNATGFSMNL